MKFLIRELDRTESTYRDKIIEIDRNYFPLPWNQEQWEELFETPNCNYFIILGLINEEIVGFALFKLVDLEEPGHLLKIVVIPDQRKKQLGFKLLEEAQNMLVIRGVSSFYLEVETSNKKALALYKSHGYQILHCSSNFYGRGQDCYTMRRG